MRYHSHIGQDRWVAETFNFRRDAYFLEFGAFDGVSSSNTLALERDLGWQGIAVEANPTYYPSLCRTRTCVTVNAALWPVSRISVEMIDAHGLSCVTGKMEVGGQPVTGDHFAIETINPTELLRRFRAPRRIEYLSLDVEGCEIEVLGALDLDFYEIALLTIEHSERPERQEAIRSLLLPRGYQVFRHYYDDWFYHPGYLEQRVLPNETFDPAAAYERVSANYVVNSL